MSIWKFKKGKNSLAFGFGCGGIAVAHRRPSRYWHRSARPEIGQATLEISTFLPSMPIPKVIFVFFS
jgi:hypothetical protein